MPGGGREYPEPADPGVDGVVCEREELNKVPSATLGVLQLEILASDADLVALLDLKQNYFYLIL